MHSNTIDHDQLERIEAADVINEDDGDDDRQRTFGFAADTNIDQ